MTGPMMSRMETMPQTNGVYRNQPLQGDSPEAL